MEFQALVDEIARLVQNPGADPLRVAVLVGLIVCLFLSVALFVLILIPEDEEEEDGSWEAPSEEDPRAEGRAAAAEKIYMVLTIVLVAGLAAGLFYADSYTRSNSGCNLCHELEQAFSSWNADPGHDGVDCVTCHRSPGLLGFADTRIRGVANALAHFELVETVATGAPASGTARKDLPAGARGRLTGAGEVVVDFGACRSCHERDLARPRVWDGVRVRHADLEQAPCTRCHENVGHALGAGREEGPPPIPPRSVMAVCVDCHVQTDASQDCGTCHVGDIMRTTVDPAALAKIDLPEPESCEGCHDLEACNACHGIEMPHPPGFADPKEHAPLGAFGLNESCDRCHDEGCTQCHRALRTNHGPNWVEEHKKRPAGGGCVRVCHDKELVGEDMCALCH